MARRDARGPRGRHAHEPRRAQTRAADVGRRACTPPQILAFDGLLESVHREHLSPFDLRVLLRVADREATPGDLTESMGQPPSVLRRASARLVARGLLRRRRRRDRHHHLELTLATTASGISALWRVTRAREHSPTDPTAVLVAPKRRTPTASIKSGRPTNLAPAAPLPRRESGARSA
jgi:DNA-binding MarR family transcriptional regulator